MGKMEWIWWYSNHCREWYCRFFGLPICYQWEAGTLVGIIGGTTMASSSALTAGQWAHVALVRNSGTWSVSYNGTTFFLSNNITTPATPTGNFTIGSNQSGSQVFDGTIDEVKFWTVARGGTQVISDMDACSTVAKNRTLGYWSFNEGSGFRANDGSGNVEFLNMWQYYMDNNGWCP